MFTDLAICYIKVVLACVASGTGERASGGAAIFPRGRIPDSSPILSRLPGSPLAFTASHSKRTCARNPASYAG